MSPLEADILKARNRFVAWVQWYMENYPDKVSGQNDLARNIGVAGPTLTYLLQAGSTRSPSFETLMGFRRFTGISIETLLFTDPPSPIRR